MQYAAGLTGNDVVTAVVAGVLRDWLTAHDELPNKSLVAICPVTVRSREHASDEDQHGNLFGLELCPLGTDSADPAERLAHIHRAMTWAKHQVASRGSNATTLAGHDEPSPAVGCSRRNAARKSLFGLAFSSTAATSDKCLVDGDALFAGSVERGGAAVF